MRGAGTRIMDRDAGRAVPRRGIARTLGAMRIGRRDVALTNLDKVFFPGAGLTKGDLVSLLRRSRRRAR